jgi:hypothetical protein
VRRQAGVKGIAATGIGDLGCGAFRTRICGAGKAKSITSVQCYYLPAVANGRVTGVQERTNVKLDYYGPHHGPHYGPAIGGAAIGSTSCRFLPTVVNGRVTGTHQVCG